VPFASLNTNASVQAWAATPSSYAHVTLSSLPNRPSAAAAQFRVNYGMPAACLVSQPFTVPVQSAGNRE